MEVDEAASEANADMIWVLGMAGWFLLLLYFCFQFFKRQNMTPFLAVSFAILAQHDAMKKRGERLPFLLSSFLFFYFHSLNSSA